MAEQAKLYILLCNAEQDFPPMFILKIRFVRWDDDVGSCRDKYALKSSPTSYFPSETVEIMIF